MTALDLGLPMDLTRALGPDLLLMAGAMILLLWAAWRPDSNAHQRQWPTHFLYRSEQTAWPQRTVLVRIGKEIQEVSREVSRAPRVLSQGAGAPDGEAARDRALAAPSPPTASFASLMPRGGSPGHPRLAHNPLARATRNSSSAGGNRDARFSRVNARAQARRRRR